VGKNYLRTRMLVDYAKVWDIMLLHACPLKENIQLPAHKKN